MEQTATLVSLEEYLAASYRPDAEFLNGVLKEKPVVSPPHGKTQMVLGWWFGMHGNEWSVQVVAESRTRVTVDRVRLPDASVLRAGPLPKQALMEPALVAIEVLSETDSYRDLKDRARDLEAMGVPDIWLLDPMTNTAEVWTDGDWRTFSGVRLQAKHPLVYFDLPWLWEQVGTEA